MTLRKAIVAFRFYIYDTVLGLKGKENFLRSLNGHSILLDVGCGNSSPYYTKRLLPECQYIGIDVSEYHQDRPNLADQYVLSRSADFAAAIEGFREGVDAVVSNHNLEHVDDREAVLEAMVTALRPGGRIFLAFPSADSVNYPKGREGTLNYFDDPTHKALPPDFDWVLGRLQSKGCSIDCAERRYQHWYWKLRGWLNEARSRDSNRVLKGTWALYGYESIIWARRAQG